MSSQSSASTNDTAAAADDEASRSTSTSTSTSICSSPSLSSLRIRYHDIYALTYGRRTYNHIDEVKALKLIQPLLEEIDEYQKQQISTETESETITNTDTDTFTDTDADAKKATVTATSTINTSKDATTSSSSSTTTTTTTMTTSTSTSTSASDDIISLHICALSLASMLLAESTWFTHRTISRHTEHALIYAHHGISLYQQLSHSQHVDVISYDTSQYIHQHMDMLHMIQRWGHGYDDQEDEKDAMNVEFAMGQIYYVIGMCCLTGCPSSEEHISSAQHHFLLSASFLLHAHLHHHHLSATRLLARLLFDNKISTSEQDHTLAYHIYCVLSISPISCPHAMTSRAWCYHQGRGVAHNQEEAIKWYRLAASAGEGYACTRLGEHYQQQAESLSHILRHQHHASDDEMLKQQIIDAHRNAMIWFERGCEYGSNHAMFSLAEYYQSWHPHQIQDEKEDDEDDDDDDIPIFDHVLIHTHLVAADQARALSFHQHAAYHGYRQSITYLHDYTWTQMIHSYRHLHAYHWCRTLIDLGDMDAFELLPSRIYRLAICYEHGACCVDVNPMQAYKMYQCLDQLISDVRLTCLEVPLTHIISAYPHRIVPHDETSSDMYIPPTIINNNQYHISIHSSSESIYPVHMWEVQQAREWLQKQWESQCEMEREINDSTSTFTSTSTSTSTSSYAPVSCPSIYTLVAASWYDSQHSTYPIQHPFTISKYTPLERELRRYQDTVEISTSYISTTYLRAIVQMWEYDDEERKHDEDEWKRVYQCVAASINVWNDAMDTATYNLQRPHAIQQVLRSRSQRLHR